MLYCLFIVVSFSICASEDPATIKTADQFIKQITFTQDENIFLLEQDILEELLKKWPCLYNNCLTRFKGLRSWSYHINNAHIPKRSMWNLQTGQLLNKSIVFEKLPLLSEDQKKRLNPEMLEAFSNKKIIIDDNDDKKYACLWKNCRALPESGSIYKSWWAHINSVLHEEGRAPWKLKPKEQLNLRVIKRKFDQLSDAEKEKLNPAIIEQSFNRDRKGDQ